MRSPQKVMLCESTTALRGVRQFYSLIEANDETKLADVIIEKEMRLLKIFSDVSFHQAVVFVRRVAWGEALAKRLTLQGLKSAFTAGSLPQERRMKVMEEMRNFQLRVLVSTDLTARGVDLTHVNLVINLDVPPSGATYMHRIGRTGRFGTSGVAISVLTVSELERLRADLSEERGGVIVPLPDVIPSSWYEYELDAEDAELFQTLKDAPIEVSSDESESEDVMDDAEALAEAKIRVRPPPPAATNARATSSRRPSTSEICRWNTPNHRIAKASIMTNSGVTSISDIPRWRAARFLSLPPGETEHPWIVPPLHADLARLPFVRHRP